MHKFKRSASALAGLLALAASSAALAYGPYGGPGPYGMPGPGPYGAGPFGGPGGPGPWNSGPWGGGPWGGNSGPFNRNVWGSGPGGWMNPMDPKRSASNMWDDMLNAPNRMGRMPGGWRAPSIDVPNPVDVADEFGENVWKLPDTVNRSFDFR